MRGPRVQWGLRLLIFGLWAGAPMGSLYLAKHAEGPDKGGEWAWMGLMAAVPPLAALAFNGSAGFYTASAFSALLALVLSLAVASHSAATGVELQISSLLPLFAVLAATVACHHFLGLRMRRGHSERQALEDLDDEVASLAEKLQDGEKALARNENRSKRYSRLQEAATQLGTTLELETLADLIMAQTLQILQERALTLSLFIFEAGGRELLRRQVDQGAGALLPPEAQAGADPLNQWVISRGTTLIIRDLEKDFRFRGLETSGLKGKCFYISPLLSSQGQVTGLLRVESLEKDALDTEDQRILESLVVLASLSAENAKLYRETQELAITDGLTKLLLRRPLLERLDSELKRSLQTGQPLAFILLDIDHFKAVNDTYGHPLGDKVLREIAQGVKRRVRDVDLCGRYGGEEFAVLLPATDLKGGLLVAERIREGVRREAFELRGDSKTITVSLGVACFPEDAQSMEALIERADEALYRSKEGGRDRVTAYSGGPA
jgi:diguanylate cyclase (GGDEF)-like protein